MANQRTLKSKLKGGKKTNILALIVDSSKFVDVLLVFEFADTVVGYRQTDTANVQPNYICTISVVHTMCIVYELIRI